MSDREPGGFGAKLREARERRGITLRQIADKTRISIGTLQALERNDISKLPGGIFSRGFVRSYALEVGLDPEATIKDFVASFPQDSVTVGHAPTRPIEDNDAIESDRRIALSALRLILIAVPLAGVVIYFVVSGRQKQAPPPASAEHNATAPAAAGGSQSDAQETAAPVSATPAATAGDTLAVVVTATDRCWVSAFVDGERVAQREMIAGEQQRFNIRRELVLTAGNAGALTLTINGVEARPLGRAGQVVTARLNQANFKDYLAPQ
jgi:cytoskeleton protein RodZ